MKRNFFNFGKTSIFIAILKQSIFILTFAILLFTSCKSPGQRPKTQEPIVDNKEDLIKNQQSIIKEEAAEIESYISRKNYQMTATTTGLRYWISKKGPGKIKVEDDSNVKFNYSVSLLDNTIVYGSDSSGAMDLIVGKSEVASGLQEGLKLLHEGDNAIFIIPSHLAYGLTGDGDKIKQYKVLVIDVELLKVRSQNQ